jgi:hypothetical protein
LDGFLISASRGSSVQATYTPSIVDDHALQPEDKENADLMLGEHRSHYGADQPWSVNGHTSQGEPTTRRAPLYLTQCLLKSAITTGPP